ncbi:MAG: tetratricopeptide repeat protein, partial [Planctomycetota bacterium]|nr:tetratricopeptide repeat protein [Planctomycetota bacterium]
MILLFADIVGSVDLKHRLGDAKVAELIRRHDAIVMETCRAVQGAEILKDTGDGFLARFSSVAEAIHFALRFQYAIHAEDWGEEPIRARVGIHLGDVAELDLDTGGMPKLSGLAVDIAARVMGLAEPAQILLTRAAFDSGRQYVREHPHIDGAAEQPRLRWMAHGPYLYKGSDEPLEIFEVGAEGIAPLEAPHDAEKARRAIKPGQEETLGWRPARGLSVPTRDKWILQKKLGQGGFGEVWLAAHQRTAAQRAFKFCFDSERLRSLKRELTLFRIMREALGDRPDIARLYEVQLEEPPYFLESEYATLGSLDEWARKKGGISKIPLETRIDLVTRAARAVAAAHSVGILHKDLKPSNILIYEDEDGGARPRIADFGIGALSDKAYVDGANITVAGFTEVLDSDDAVNTSTPMYAPPETLTGKPFTAAGDVYSLGVLLYQMVVGDLDRPLASGWERDVEDPLLREDIAACVEGHITERLASPNALVTRLSSLPERRRAALRKRLMHAGGAVLVAALLLLSVTTLVLFREHALRKEAVEERQKAEAILGFVDRTFTEMDPDIAGPDVEVRQVLQSIDDEDISAQNNPEVEAAIYDTLGRAAFGIRDWPRAEQYLRRAFDLRSQILEDSNPDLASTSFNLGRTRYWQGDYEEAAELFAESIERRRKLNGEDSLEYADALNHHAAVLDRLGQHAEAEKSFRAALAIREANPNTPRQMVAASRNNLATNLRTQEKKEEAAKYFKEALDILEELPEEEFRPTFLAGARNNAGMALVDLAAMLVLKDQTDQALESFKEGQKLLYEAYILKDKLFASEPNDSTARTLIVLARAHLEAAKISDKDFTTAEVHARQALDMMLASVAEDHDQVAQCHIILGKVLMEKKELTEAESHFQIATESLESASVVDESLLANAAEYYGRCLLQQERYEEARHFLEKSMKLVQSRESDRQHHLADIQAWYGICLTELEE